MTARTDTVKVKTLTKDNSNWDDKWDNGANTNKFADPKKYTIKTKLYKDTAKTKEIDSEDADVYVVRLGIEKIEFDSYSGGLFVPMQFHTTTTDINIRSKPSRLSRKNVPSNFCPVP